MILNTDKERGRTSARGFSACVQQVGTSEEEGGSIVYTMDGDCDIPRGDQQGRHLPGVSTVASHVGGFTYRLNYDTMFTRRTKGKPRRLPHKG